MLLQLRTVFGPVCAQPAGHTSRCGSYSRLTDRCSIGNNPVCSLSLIYACQDRKRTGSRPTLLAWKRNAVASCAQYSSMLTSTAARQSSEDVDWSNTQYNQTNSHSNHAQAVGSTAAPAQSVFDVMVGMAEDSALLKLFNPYLPKTSRTHAGLASAMKIAKWRKRVLVGESQIRESEIMRQVWRRAPDRDKLNKQLQRLGFPGLMQQNES